MKPLDRHNLRKQPNMIECIACGGSGIRSKGGSCKPCLGTGALPSGVGVPVSDLENETVRLPPASPVPQHSCESVEHYTPVDIVAASRQVLGEIDLDPASCLQAQEVVGATVWYGTGSPDGEDGLTEPWGGSVFLNPPGGVVPDEYLGMGTRSNAALWWAMLAGAWESGEVEAAIFVGFTLEVLRSAQGLGVPWPGDFPLCFPASRIPFDTPNRLIEKGKKKGQLIDPDQPAGTRVKQSSPGHANVIVYLPPVDMPRSEAAERLSTAFSEIGMVKQ